VSAKTDAVCLALTALWQAALTGIQVVDGPQANSDASDDWLFVGFNGDAPDEYNEGAVADQTMMAFLRTKQEDGQVTCAVVSRSGDTDIPSVRSRAYSFLSAAEDAVRADMQLGGLVMHAFVSGHQYSPVITQQGAKVRVVFTVTYQAQL
jgi:hypothetical protein